MVYQCLNIFLNQSLCSDFDLGSFYTLTLIPALLCKVVLVGRNGLSQCLMPPCSDK